MKLVLLEGEEEDQTPPYLGECVQCVVCDMRDQVCKRSNEWMRRWKGDVGNGCDERGRLAAKKDDFLVEPQESGKVQKGLLLFSRANENLRVASK